MNYFVGDKVKVFSTDRTGNVKFMYGAVVVEATQEIARIQVRDNTYGWQYSQHTGKKVGVDNGYFITKGTSFWRSIDDE